VGARELPGRKEAAAAPEKDRRCQVVAGRGQESCQKGARALLAGTRELPGGKEWPGRQRRTGGGVQSTAGVERAAGAPEKDRRRGPEHRRGGRSGRGARKGQMCSAMLLEAWSEACRIRKDWACEKEEAIGGRIAKGKKAAGRTSVFVGLFIIASVPI
jgi:hypothetical protein